jgi:hypothetical protein
MFTVSFSGLAVFCFMYIAFPLHLLQYEYFYLHHKGNVRSYNPRGHVALCLAGLTDYPSQR